MTQVTHAFEYCTPSKKASRSRARKAAPICFSRTPRVCSLRGPTFVSPGALARLRDGLMQSQISGRRCFSEAFSASPRRYLRHVAPRRAATILRHCLAIRLLNAMMIEVILMADMSVSRRHTIRGFIALIWRKATLSQARRTKRRNARYFRRHAPPDALSTPLISPMRY